MMVTGHHSASGYSRYDRTQDLKMGAAILASSDLGLSYEAALTRLSKKFLEKVVGKPGELKPLLRQNNQKLPLALVDIPKETLEITSEVTVTDVTDVEVGKHLVTNVLKVQQAGKRPGTDVVKVQPASAYEALHKLYDEIDWDLEISRNPLIARVLGGTSGQMSVGSNIAGKSFQNYTITISVVQPGSKQELESEKENKAPA